MIIPEIGNVLFNPLGSLYKHAYKIRISDQKINTIVQEKIAQRKGKLQNLTVRIAPKYGFIRGQAHVDKRYLRNLLHVDYVDFAFKLKISQINGQYIGFNVDNFLIKQKRKNTIDWVSIVSQWTQRVRNKVIEEFNNSRAPFFSDVNYEILYLDLNYFLRDVPDIVGNTVIEGVFFEPNHLCIIGKSNVLTMTTLGVFSTDLLEIQAINTNELDLYSNLWNIFRS